MDALRSRNEPEVSEEDIKKWKAEVGCKDEIDPLAKAEAHNPAVARNQNPRCPYLHQLAYKSLYVGNQPTYWCGAREETRHNGSLGFSLDGPRNVMGRSGIDSFSTSEVECWYLYIDVSEPLVPRYAFMQRTDIVGCTYNHHSDLYGTQLRIFNAQHHATRFLIPESEYYPAGDELGEPRFERHTKTMKISSQRSWIDQHQKRLQGDPKWQEITRIREARARVHPAVIRMAKFGWLQEHDVLKPNGTALLQEVWSVAIDSDDWDGSYVPRNLVEQPANIKVARSESSTGLEPCAPRYWEYPLPGLDEMTTEETLGLIAFSNLEHDNMLAQVAAIEGIVVFPLLKALLAQYMWCESGRGGSGIQDAVHSWLNQAGFSGRSEEEPWLAEDYQEFSDIGQTPGSTPNHTSGSSQTRLGYSIMVIFYQALCYRASVAQERSKRRGIAKSFTSSSATLLPEMEHKMGESLSDFVGSGAFTTGDYPGKLLGDVAHPAFDISSFPQMREDAIICVLRDWSQQIWMPSLDNDTWEGDNSILIPLRTLNLSGCYFVTRNTVRRALEVAPTITRIVMIGCPNFGEVDLNLLSLDGTLDNVECILTSESLRATFDDPQKKLQRRDSIYNQACSLMPTPPNDHLRDSLLTIPNVFFDSGSEKKFSFKYDSQVLCDYFANGIYNRQPSHVFARPPSIRLNPVTHKVECGPPRFSVVLASYYVAGHHVTGATLPHVPLDTGIDGYGTSSSGLSSVWRGIIDLLEFLGCNSMRNPQRWNAITWSLLVKSCFSGSGSKWDEMSGLAGGGEFFGFPAYYKGGLGQANEEWIFAYNFLDTRGRVGTSWMNDTTMLIYPEESAQDSWAFIRYGRDANPLSQQVSTVVLYDVRGFRQAVCPDIPILLDEAKWMDRVEEVLKNGVWKRHYHILNAEVDRGMTEKGDPSLERLRDAMDRLEKPRFMKETPQDLIQLIERMMVNQMNDGKDVF
ncbi:exonuclease V subunit beta [Ceratobasidium sp. AG-Ba]|nr:exonuclease V subunit beta [Ceratobasidium sp. AG-Ba]